MRRIDLVGRTFNNWTVLEYAGQKGYACQCKCGKVKVINGSNLRTGASRSCRQCSANAIEVANKLPLGEGAFNDLFNRYLASARKRKLEFEISKPLAKMLFILPCNYCRQPPTSIWPTGRSDMNGTFAYSGLDRVDSSRGYISTNIVPCCKTCNYMKQSLSEMEFLAHIHRISAFREAL